MNSTAKTEWIKKNIFLKKQKQCRPLGQFRKLQKAHHELERKAPKGTQWIRASQFGQQRQLSQNCLLVMLKLQAMAWFYQTMVAAQASVQFTDISQHPWVLWNLVTAKVNEVFFFLGLNQGIFIELILYTYVVFFALLPIRRSLSYSSNHHFKESRLVEWVDISNKITTINLRANFRNGNL